MPRLIPLLIWSIPLLCGAGFAHAAGVVKEVIAVTGNAAPAVSADAVWSRFDSPSLDSAGNLALGGFVTEARTQNESEVCLLRVPNGEFQLRARAGDWAPGQQLAEDPMTISSLSPYGCQGGNVLFYGSVARSGIETSAVMVSTPGGLQLVARRGEQLPGMPGPFNSFRNMPRLDPGGGVTFSVAGADYPKAYTYRRELDGAPELIGISNLPSVVLGSKAGFGVISAPFTDAGTSTIDSVRRLHPDRSVIIAQAGLPIPGNEPYQFTSAVVNSCNDSGKVLFRAGYGVAGQTVTYALWLGDGENPAERIAQQGEPIPGSKSTVQGFDHFAVNGAGDVAFFSGPILCLKRHGQPLKAVAYPGMPVPPNGSWMPNFGANGLQLSANGNLVFGNDDGVWAYTADNQIVQIARSGERIAHEGVEYVISKTVVLPSGTGGQDGRRRMLSDNGRVAFLAVLTRVGDNDNSPNSGIILAKLTGYNDPAEAPIAAPDTATFRSAAGVAIRIRVLDNDSSPVGRAFDIHSVTQGVHGKVTIEGNTLRYVPDRSFAGEDSITYTIVDSEGNYGTGVVTVRNPFLALRGTYASDQDPAARLNITVGGNGRLTGRVLVNGRPFVLSGMLGEDGVFTKTFKTAQGAVSVWLHVGVEAEGPTVWGSVEMADGTGYSFAETTAFGPPADLVSPRVTMELRPPDSRGPNDPNYQSIGFAIGKVATSGRITLAGRLPDNRPFTTGSRMRRDGSFTIEHSPYGKGRGVLRGLLQLAGGSEEFTRWGGTLEWTRVQPANSASLGFETTLAADLATFRVEPGASSIQFDRSWLAELIISAGPIYTEHVWFDQNDLTEFAEPNWSRAQLRIDRSTGLVKGSFVSYPGTPVRRAFQGVVFQPNNEAAGIVPFSELHGYFLLRRAY